MTTDTHATTCSAAQDAQIAELENLIYLARHAQVNLAWHKANLLEWLTTWCADHPSLGNYCGETRLQARALSVYTTVLYGAERQVYYYRTDTPGLFTKERESREDWDARNRRESAILARNIVLRNADDYEDLYGIRK